ncbi:MAG TPA: hypothetical protein VJY15_13285 [Candidatus Acidoferrum sp.]|nr:hypothetical protein [Candidatus Acidoferrum sp.]
MSNERAKILAQKFMEEQKKILREYGDTVVESNCKEAVSSVTKVFKAIGTSPKQSAQAKS